MYPLISFKHNYRRLILALFIVTIALVGTALPQTTLCPSPLGCTANNVELRGFNLTITSECDPITHMATARLNATVFLNQNTANCVTVFADVYQGGQFYETKVFHLGTLSKAGDAPALQTVICGYIQWQCGKNMDLKNIMIIWDYCETDCPLYGTPSKPNYSQCNSSVPDFHVVIPGITVRKIVDTGTINCVCSQGTSFPVSISETTIPYSDSHSFDCNPVDWVISPLAYGKNYNVTEFVTPGWNLYTYTVTSSLGAASYTSKVRGAEINLRQNEEVVISFTNRKCPQANAGPNNITCAGDFVIVEGNASCFNSVGWEMAPSCLGILTTPLDGNYSKAKYTPKQTTDGQPLDTLCKLYFNVTGACPGIYSDNMTIYIIEEPNAVIRAWEPEENEP